MMKLTLKQKREIVREFKSGISTWTIARVMGGFVDFGTDDVEDSIRDFINGKFTLPAPKRRKP